MNEDTSDSSRKIAARWIGPRLGPLILIILGILIAFWIAYRSRQSAPPSATESGFLVLASAAFNIAGSYLFARIGRADPNHARSAVRRLLSVGKANGLALSTLSDALDRNDSLSLDEAAQQVRGILLACQGPVSDAMRDWNDIHTEALREVLLEEEKKKKEQEGTG